MAQPGFMGVLMLETRFPRPPGDIGAPETWAFPVRYRIVRGASPDLAVRGGAAGLLTPFIEAGQVLAAEGATLIATSCGFLSLFQKAMSAALPVPVVTSSLLQAASVQKGLPAGRTVGVLTISAETLTETHLKAAGVPLGTPVGGVAPGCHFQNAILKDERMLDMAMAEADVVAAAVALQAANPALGAILLECGNMPPYAGAVAAATGLPVFSIVTFLNNLMSRMRR